MIMKNPIQNSKIVIKLGTKAVFNPAQKEIQRGIIQDMAKDVVKLLDKNNEIIIVSSGAVGCGKHIISGNGNLGTKQAQAAVGQIELMKEYSEAFSKFDLNVAQFLLNSNDFLQSERLENIKTTYNCLGKNTIAIINENDVTSTGELSFGDNDYLAAKILDKFNFDTLLVLTNLGALIRDGKEILESNKFSVKDYDKLSSDDRFGFGGLKSKLDVAKKAVSDGKNFIIGKAGNSVIEILEHKKSGTWFYLAKV